MKRLRDWLRHLGHTHDHDHGGWEDLMCGCECLYIPKKERGLDHE